MKPLIIILLISVAGPVIGSLIGVLKKPSERFMFCAMAFAGGVMLAISFMELIPKGINMSSIPLACIGILLGASFMYLLDKALPHLHPELCRQEHCHKLRKTALYLIIGIFMHNFPEGMAIAIGTVTDFKLTLVIASSIAIHNIPEAICTSSPYYFTSGKKLKAFLLSSSTAIPIVVGFLVAKFVYQIIPLQIVGMIIAATAGLMIYISGDELIPCSCAKKQEKWEHIKIFSLVLGVILVVLLGLI